MKSNANLAVATPLLMTEIFSAPDALVALHALGQHTRLKIFRLLLRCEPEGITAAEIAEAIGASKKTVSSHLAILTRSRLVAGSRHGRSIICHANIEGVRSLMSYLLADCCNGHPGVFAPILTIPERS